MPSPSLRRILAAALLLSAVGTLSQARIVRVRDVVSLREAVAGAQPGDTILLKKGVYRLDKPLVIEGRSGLVIRPERGRAEFNGGKRISRRLIRRARGFPRGVKCIDVSSLDVEGPRSIGHARQSLPSWSALFADGVPMRLSQWPDDGWIPLDSVVSTGISIRFNGRDSISTVAPSADLSLFSKGAATAEIAPAAQTPDFGSIGFRGDRPFCWSDPAAGFLAGCFRYGWAYEMIPIGEIRPDRTIAVADTTYYGFGRKEGETFQKWRVLNMPEEVTVRGEYAIDGVRGRIWTLLPRGTRRLEISLLTEPLVCIRSCDSLVLEGLDFSCTRGDALAMASSSSVRVEDCVFHNIGHIAAVIDRGCTRCGLASCRIYDTGAGGVKLDGGDRKAVVRGDNYLEDCVLHDFNRIEQSNRPGVRMEGLGNRVSGCEFYNSYTQAILMLGNDHLIERCDIHDVCLDVEDCGAVYYGRDPSFRGGVIRWNYFHDILAPRNVRAVYHDDGACACEVYGNVFNRISSPPVQIGGGSDIVYHDNIFMNLDCAAVKIDARLKTWGADRLPFMLDQAAKVDGPAFRMRYPEFASYLEGDPADPSRNVLVRNVFYNVKWAFEKVVWSDHDYNDTIEGTANFISEMHDNWKTAANPGFIDPDNPLAGFVPAPAVLDSIPGFILPSLPRRD